MPPPSLSNPDVTALIPIHRDKGNREWLQQAVNSLGGIKHLILENDGEVEEALDFGVRNCDTEFYIPFGSDDIADPEYLNRLRALSWEADVVYPGLMMTDENLKLLGGGDPEPFCPNRLLRMNYVPGPSLVRTAKAIEAGGYRELGALEDWDLWVRMLRKGARFKPARGAVVYYRQHEAGRNNEARNDDEFRAEMRRKIIGEEPPPGKATFYCQDTPATTYLRCQLPAKHLPGLVYPGITALLSEDDVLFPEQEGAAIFQFPGDAQRMQAFGLMRAKGTRVLVEVDDNYLLNPGKFILKNSGWGMKIGDMPNSRQGHRWIAERADGIIVTTEHLAKSYRKLGVPVYICPNTIDPDDWGEPNAIDDGIFRIGWAASRSHRGDTPLVAPAFKWAAQQDGVEVYIVGMDSQLEGVHTLPWIEDLHGYRRVFSSFDVGVAPIKAEPFALYRSDIKALEIAMGGGLPILSDVEPYEDWKDKPALIAKNAAEFTKHIKWAVSHRDEVRQMAKEAREYVLKERTTAAQIHCWEEAIDPH